MLPKFTKMLFPPKEIIGIDIGSYSVKLVCFTEDKKTITLKDWGIIQLAVKPDTPPDEKKAIISEEIKNYLKKQGIEARRAAASVSGNSVIVRYVKLPKLSHKELALTINVEAEPFIPFDINDVRLTYAILNDLTEDGEAKMETVLVAAKKEAVQDKIDILEGAGLDPVIVDVDPVSWCIDPNEVIKAISPRTKAIIPVHLYGQPCDMDALSGITPRMRSVSGGFGGAFRGGDNVVEFSARGRSRSRFFRWSDA